MTTKLTKKEIEHVANLARLDLSDKELKTYGEQLSKVLGYIDQLKEVDTTGVEPTAQVTGLENVLREDAVSVCDESDRKEALRQAPDLEGEQVKVKRVIE